MARSKKRTVDYFPHDVSHGKTIYILEDEFENDGYAFWFKLQEILGSTDGHYYEYSNYADKKFLLAKTRVNEEKAEEILNLLGEINAINKDLWEKDKIIWSDIFIENISDAYTRRKANLPQKPKCTHDDSNKLYDDNKNKNEKEGCSKDENNYSKYVNSCSKDEDKNPQRKEKESKVNKIKEKERKEKIQYAVPYQEIARLYNKKCSDMTKVIKISDTRKKHLKARWQDAYSLVSKEKGELSGYLLKEKVTAVFADLFEKAGSSDFMNGKNERDWQADFDWLIKNNNNFTKVLEGKYDNKDSPEVDRGLDIKKLEQNGWNNDYEDTG